MYLSHLCLHKNLASKLTGENIYSQSLCAKNQGALGSIRVPPEIVTKLLVTSFCLGSLTGCEERSHSERVQRCRWCLVVLSRVHQDSQHERGTPVEAEVLNNLGFRMSTLLVTQIFKAEAMQMC